MMNLCPILHNFGDLNAENCYFFSPHSYLMSSLGVNPFEFPDNLIWEKPVLRLSIVVILALLILIQHHTVTDKYPVHVY